MEFSEGVFKRECSTHLSMVPMTIPPALPQYARCMPTLLYVATTNLDTLVRGCDRQDRGTTAYL